MRPLMKKTAHILVLLLLSITAAFAQEWQTDFNTAKELASAQNKPLILVFQGSDWCAPCIKLDREIWSSDAFKNYAQEHYVMLLADFPRRKKNALPEEQAAANAKLAETYNTIGAFPFVVVLDSNGKVLGQTAYKKVTPEVYIKELNSFVK
jgi:thioredoxin-related protein